MNPLKYLLAAASAVLALALLAAVYLISQTTSRNAQLTQQNQALLTGDAAVHAKAVEIAGRLHLDPNGATLALLQHIEKQIGPRRIDAGEAATIANALLSGPAYSFQIDVLSNDREAESFARQLLSTLLLANWTPAGAPIVNAFTPGMFDVMINAGTQKAQPAAAAALARAFAQVGIAVDPDRTGKTYAPPGVIEIMVGTKP
jgi:hypothetical protein